VATIFPANGALLDFFFLGYVMWLYFTNCLLESGSKCWKYISFPVTVFDRKPLTSCIGEKISNDCIAYFLCASVSILGIQRAQTLEQTSRLYVSFTNYFFFYEYDYGVPCHSLWSTLVKHVPTPIFSLTAELLTNLGIIILESK
jgi:hypothetical protein